MGMFTWVEPDNAVLPPEYRELKDWQTKDVIECALETLVISATGQLIHVWHEYETVEDASTFSGFYLRPTTEHRDILDYHGDMRFYTTTTGDRSSPDYAFIELVARFTEGKLQWIRPVLPDARNLRQ